MRYISITKNTVMPAYVLWLSLALVCALSACERPYEPKTVFPGPQIVVEGYVESGPNALPPYVFLTRSYDYRSSLGPSDLGKLFVQGAEVYVSDGDNEVRLRELCLSEVLDLEPALRDIAAVALGFNPGDLDEFNFCIYIDVDGFVGRSPLRIETGRTYNLRIIGPAGEQLSASTTLTRPVPLDTVFYRDHPSYPQNDSLVELLAAFQDPPQERNYYRLFSRRNMERYYPASSFAVGSVTDDAIFEGQAFTFPIQRGQSRTASFDPVTFGYFWRGDTVTLRASTMDYAHFRFWQTAEYSSSTQGPFGTYVRIQSNVQGGLGIWGGLSFNEYRLIIPR